MTIKPGTTHITIQSSLGTTVLTVPDTALEHLNWRPGDSMGAQPRGDGISIQSLSAQDRIKNTNKRIAVYYCFIGESTYPSAVIPKIPIVCKIHNPIDFYFFTQNEEIFKRASLVPGLKCRLIECDATSQIDQVMASKFYKVLPHKIPELKEYDYTLYLDTKLEISTPAWGVTLTEDFIKSTFTPDLKFGVFKHLVTRNSLDDEIKESFLQKRYLDQSDKIGEYILNKEVFEKYGTDCEIFFQSGYLFRKMNDPLVEEICEHWMEEIEKCGTQCQISFHYVYKKYKEHIKEIIRP